LCNPPTHWPGQGVELAIKHPDWPDARRPYTPASLGDDAVLEFTIKCYPDGDGVTRELHRLQVVAELLLNEPFGSKGYQRLLALNQAARSVIEEVRENTLNRRKLLKKSRTGVVETKSGYGKPGTRLI